MKKYIFMWKTAMKMCDWHGKILDNKNITKWTLITLHKPLNAF